MTAVASAWFFRPGMENFVLMPAQAEDRLPPTADEVVASTRGSARTFPNYIDLTQADLVAEGNMRLVYETKSLPGVLIKVIKPEFIDDEGFFCGTYANRRGRRFKPRRRVGALLVLKRELTEQLALRKSRKLLYADWPIARMYGFAETDKGFGILTEKLTDGSGRLAPNLHQLLTEGRFLPGHYDALIAMFDQLEKLHVCIGDMHPFNIVYSGDLPNGRFVGVDGYGEKAAIPLADWFSFANAYQVRRRAKKILRYVDKYWSPTAQSEAGESLSVDAV